MISFEKQFIFIHRGKSAGNAISKAIAPQCEDINLVQKHSHQDGINRFEVESTVIEHNKHSDISVYYNQLTRFQFNEFYKFSVLRNPFSRLVSAYFSPHRIINQGNDDFVRDSFRLLIEKQRTFREFVCMEKHDALDKHMDQIIVFENIDRDFELVTRHIFGFPISLNRVNVGKTRSYRQYYDAELRELTECRFEEELNYGHYQF